MNPCSVPEMPRYAGFREAQSSLIPSAPASDEEFDMTAPTPQRCRLFHHPPHSPLDVRQSAPSRSQHRKYLVVPSLYINATVPCDQQLPTLRSVPHPRCALRSVHSRRKRPTRPQATTSKSLLDSQPKSLLNCAHLQRSPNQPVTQSIRRPS
jgi:hypothetical protein